VARVLAALVVVSGAVLASFSFADGVDPSAPATIVVGAPRGFAPRARLGDTRLGQSSSLLPTSASELWRRELTSGLDFPPVVDASGGVIAALVSPEVVRLGPDGRQSWRERLGGASAAVAPIITSDGSVAVLCTDGTFWRVSARGRVSHGVDLQTRTKNAAATPLALDDGSVILASERALLHVDADGKVRARVPFSERAVGGLIAYRGGVLVTTQDGGVFSWRAPGSPRKLGDFGGMVQHGGALLSKRTLVAVVQRERVLALDLPTGTTTVLADGAGLRHFEGPVTLDQAGIMMVTSGFGELFGLDGHGMLVRRVLLDNIVLPTSTDAGVPFPSMFRATPPLIVDAAGTVAFVRNNGRFGLVDDQGMMSLLDPRVCSRPLAVLPSGKGRLLVACRSGSVILWGNKP